MRLSNIQSRLMQNLLLAAFLVAAQWGSLAHAFEHEAGRPQSQVCATCVAANQLGFACIDSPLPVASLPTHAILNSESAQVIEPHRSLDTRQRGPPSPI